MSAGPILLYDGDCAFCARSVQFLLAHDRRRGDARFAAREGAAGRRLLAAHPRAAAVDSLVWIDTEGGVERAAVRYAAVLSIARYLGGLWALLAGFGWFLPRPVGDAAYDWVARRRRRLAGGADACVVFTPAERARVMD